MALVRIWLVIAVVIYLATISGETKSKNNLPIFSLCNNRHLNIFESFNFNVGVIAKRLLHDYGDLLEDGKSDTSRTTGPVFTVIKTDPKANIKWGVRHYVGRKYH